MESERVNSVWPEWKVVRELGQGSYGTVYEVVREEAGLETHAAVKVISIPPSDGIVRALSLEDITARDTNIFFKSVIDNFVMEIELMESFKGVQNIVSIEDYKVIEKDVGFDIFIRMELLTPLDEYRKTHEVTEKDVVHIGVDICSALERCEKRNIIHRDIKPENIFVNSFGDFKLGDFGIARKLEDISASLTSIGTMNYMAPEVRKGEPYDSRADFYSLGLVLYRILNKNRLPFLDLDKQLLTSSERAEANRRRFSGEKLPAPLEASTEMAAIILKACEFNPSYRYASASEMKAALEALSVGKREAQSQEKNSREIMFAAEDYCEKPALRALKEKKGRAVSMTAVLLLLALAAGGLLATSGILPFGADREKAVETEESIALLADTSENDEAEQNSDKQKAVSREDREEVQRILERAAEKAETEEYEDALWLIQFALEKFPAAEELISAKNEYEVLAAKKEASVLAQTEAGTEEENAGQKEDDQLPGGNTEAEDPQALASAAEGDEEEEEAQPVYKAQSLLSECPPYEYWGASYGQTHTIKGDAYADVLNIKEWTGYIHFNLKGKYSILCFDAGHIDNKGTSESSIVIYGDGELLTTVSLTSNMKLTHYELDVDGVERLYIAGNQSNGAGSYGLVNVKVTPSGKEGTKLPMMANGYKSILNVCPPYQSWGTDYGDSLKVFGDIYANTIRIKEGTGYLDFNLKGKYSTLSFDIGPVDGGRHQDNLVTILCDGEPALSVVLKNGMSIEHYDLDLENVERMRICGTGTSPFGFAFLNVGLKANGKEGTQASSMKTGAKSLLSECLPTDYWGVSTGGTYSVLGDTYTNCVRVTEATGHIDFNLDGKYATLIFDVGHIDGAGSNESALSIVCDGEPAQSIVLTSKMSVEHYEVSVKDVEKMTIQANAFSVGEYCLFNIGLK